MNAAARCALALGGAALIGGCATQPDASTAAPPDGIASAASGRPAPSPHRVIGRVLATDLPAGRAWVELGDDLPAGALADGAELTTRRLDFVRTGQLRASRYRQGRTLGTLVVAGQPAEGDEVVWTAP